MVTMYNITKNTDGSPSYKEGELAANLIFPVDPWMCASREDEWRICNRVVVVDWFRQYPDSADWSAGPLGQQLSPGGRKPEDPSYVLAGLSV
jgi:hypothetical protein